MDRLDVSPATPASWIRQVGTALVHDPLPVGGVAAALMASTMAIFGLPLDVPLLVLGACGTALVYAADRALGLSPEDALNRPRRVAWVRASRTWWVVEAAVLFVGAVTAFVWVEPATQLAALATSGLGAAYLLPILPGRKRLKEIPLAKPLFVTTVWAVSAVAVPLLEAGRAPGWDAVGLALYRAALIAPNVLLVDWADRLGDARAGLPVWTDGWTLGRLRAALVAVIGAGLAGMLLTVDVTPLWLADGAGLVAMAVAVCTLRPDRRPSDAFWLDLLVATPSLFWILDFTALRFVDSLRSAGFWI